MSDEQSRAEVIDLTYIGLALERLSDDVATMRDQMIVQGAIITRLDNGVTNLTVEVRAVRSLLDRVLERVRKAEARADILSEAAAARQRRSETEPTKPE